jgi:hypothetical protein
MHGTPCFSGSVFLLLFEYVLVFLASSTTGFDRLHSGSDRWKTHTKKAIKDEFELTYHLLSISLSSGKRLQGENSWDELPKF